MREEKNDSSLRGDEFFYSIRSRHIFVVVTVIMVICYLPEKEGERRQVGGLRDVPSVTNIEPEAPGFWGDEDEAVDLLEWPQMESVNPDHMKVEDQANMYFPYSAESIAAGLQRVRLDESDNVIVDHDTLQLLEETVGYRGLRLNVVALVELQQLIEFGLPGSAGQQAALLAANFYNYTKAEREYIELHRDINNDQNYENHKNHIAMLREVYLGREVAMALFARRDAQNEYFYKSFMLSADHSLSDAERQKAERDLVDDYNVKLASTVGLEYEMKKLNLRTVE